MASHQLYGHMYYFEDLGLDFTAEYGSETLSKDEIIDFAEKYDPQPFHIDEAAAERSIFGGIVASGLHTLAICNKMSYHALYRDLEIVAGKGIDGLRFYEPVFPGDTLSIRVQIKGLTASEGTPDRGLVDIGVEGYRNEEEAVVSYTTYSYVKRDPERT